MSDNLTTKDLSEGFDPRMLVDAARKQAPSYLWLPDALANCPKGNWRSRAYVHYVSSKNANQPGAEWQHDKCVTLTHDTLGTVIIDVLKGDRIGGIEFFDRIGEDD
jgi:hypothetical protein